MGEFTPWKWARATSDPGGPTAETLTSTPLLGDHLFQPPAGDQGCSPSGNVSNTDFLMPRGARGGRGVLPGKGVGCKLFEGILGDEES